MDFPLNLTSSIFNGLSLRTKTFRKISYCTAHTINKVLKNVIIESRYSVIRCRVMRAVIKIINAMDVPLINK